MLTIVDLVLHAAQCCHLCRSAGRPKDESDQEHGDSFVHIVSGQAVQCAAEAVWTLHHPLAPEAGL